MCLIAYSVLCDSIVCSDSVSVSIVSVDVCAVPDIEKLQTSNYTAAAAAVVTVHEHTASILF
jgi:hypothetical protein